MEKSGILSPEVTKYIYLSLFKTVQIQASDSRQFKIILFSGGVAVCDSFLSRYKCFNKVNYKT